MPQVGDTTHAHEIGRKTNHHCGFRLMVWFRCPKCGKEYWTTKDSIPKTCINCYRLIAKPPRTAIPAYDDIVKLSPPCSNAICDWVTGFTEGDGSISRGDKYHNNVIIRYGQKVADPLNFMQSQFGGVVRRASRQYDLCYYGTKSYALIRALMNRCVSNYYTMRLNRALEFIHLSPTCPTQPTLDWFAGFWDADGSSNNKCELTLDQKEPQVLESVASVFGGRVYSFKRSSGAKMCRWVLCGRQQTNELAHELIKRSHYPQKIARLAENRNGIGYYLLRKASRLSKERIA
jgi:hypothetical protein